MKRHSRLWPKLVSFENLYLAYRKARRGKRNSRAATRFEHHLERELSELRLDLITQTYRPGPYRTFTIHDVKPRLISAAPFRDRVVHHALCNVLEPVFERSFGFDSESGVAPRRETPCLTHPPGHECPGYHRAVAPRPRPTEHILCSTSIVNNGLRMMAKDDG